MLLPMVSCRLPAACDDDRGINPAKDEEGITIVLFVEVLLICRKAWSLVAKPAPSIINTDITPP